MENKIFQIIVDTMLITIILEPSKKLIDVLIEEDNNFYELDEIIYYKFDENYTEKCIVNDITEKTGIIQFESH